MRDKEANTNFECTNENGMELFATTAFEVVRENMVCAEDECDAFG